MSQNLEKLRNLLAELFQFDQADLDFGIYRIMNAKRAEITRFLEKDLLPEVRNALSAYEEENRAVLQEELKKAEEQARALGFGDPTQAPKVKELQARYNAGFDLEAAENDVYSHLYNFFRRYYSEGDFISQRRYKEGVYAIPYEGEEVKLYWANYDQYYIKTGEYFRDYTFKLPSGKRVHFKLVEADTEKDNNRAPAGNERRFILGRGDRETGGQADVCEEINGELVIYFRYVPDPQKRKQADLNTEAVERIRSLITKSPSLQAVWSPLIEKPQPEKKEKEKESDRTLLEKHLTDYTARNTFDYFIHKDLGGFLRRELDFYIKNEVMHLDDIESESAPRVEQYLAKIKAIRRIAHKIIDFLAQIENFQKKLWLKKKFVVETHYCVTLDRVPEELYPEIAANDAQREEWVRLYGDIGTGGEGDKATNRQGDTGTLFSEDDGLVTLSPGLRVSKSCMIDTRHFSEDFKLRLLASFDDLDEQCDGLLVHSENFQALNLLTERYWGQVKCVYIDPPYNTGTDGFAYKDTYQHSTWLAMLESRIRLSKVLLLSDGLFFSSIDDIEVSNLRRLCDELFGSRNFVGTLTWISTTQPDNIGRARFGLQQNVEYVLLYSSCDRLQLPPFVLKHSGVERRYPHTGRFGRCRFEIIERAFEGAYARPTMQFRILGQLPREGKQWQIGEDTARALEAAGKVELVDGIVKRAVYPEDEQDQNTGLIPFWAHLRDTGTSQTGKSELTAILGRGHGLDTVKPVSLLCRILEHVQSAALTVDFFAGSGTTAHAVINLNREDGGRRKYILVEMGAYFDTVLLPRIKKVVYSKDWKDGKPVSRDGISHMFKYIRLESYEDTLNNLELKRTEVEQSLFDQNDEFREDYMLHYMLDVESRGSASLLNLDRFENPFSYELNIATGTVGETKPTVVDLVETFNYLIGLRVKTIDHIGGVRVVTGFLGQGERVLILWRNTKEMDNDKLDEWFRKQGYNTRDQEFDVIYVNGDNNLQNLRKPDQTWKVRLIEEEFLRRMFDVADI
jgi:adenine-specific DNA-methyltransferase